MMITITFVPDVMQLIVYQAFHYQPMNHSTQRSKANNGTDCQFTY
jgi:hypothetical protein